MADTGDAVGAEKRVDLVSAVGFIVVGAGGPPEGQGGGVPDGIDDDVVDGAERAEAVATDGRPRARPAVLLSSAGGSREMASR